MLLYTSGTTGKPKGAELTHFQLFMNCTVAGELFEFRDDDIGLAVLPLFHVFGLSSVLNMTVRYGGTMVLVPRFEIGPVVDAIEQHRCTIFSGVPTMYFALLAADMSRPRPVRAAGRRLRRRGDPRRDDPARSRRSSPACVVLEGYGLSESASTTTFNINAEQRKVLSIGKPIWGVEVRVVDETDKPLPAGPEHVGEIVIRGHNIMKGYYKQPEATAEAFKGGWFHTGDLGYRDEDGFLFIVDRKKDLVIRGGYNVYPREIEEVLYEHPAVAEAAVIGKPDDKLGEEVVAVVTLKAGAERRAAGGHRLLQGAARGLQVPARGAHRRRAAEGTHRQDPQEGAPARLTCSTTSAPPARSRRGAVVPGTLRRRSAGSRRRRRARCPSACGAGSRSRRARARSAGRSRGAHSKLSSSDQAK